MLSLEAGSVVGGKYRLERPLAGGAMGFLWVARHLQLDVQVAIKFMRPQHADSPVARARFEREAKASAQLRTPNVVHVYDYGLEGDTPYLAMELLEGEDLAAYLVRRGRLAPAETLGIMVQVCKALRRAHEVGLIHRDLKPANIFLARQGEEVVKILDFGVAKATGTGLAADATKTGTLIGSPHYMSPEQVRRSKTMDHRSDLWSLGVIIFQCVTGQLPFPGEELGDVLVEICTGDIPVPSQLAPDLWPELDQFLARALKRDPAERFQSASELAHAFAAAVHRTPFPEPRDAMDSTGALAALGSAPALGRPGAGSAPALGALAALGSAPALGVPGPGNTPALGSAPSHAPPGSGNTPALGSAPSHAPPGSGNTNTPAPGAPGSDSAPAFRGGTVALDVGVGAGGTLTAGETVVAGRMQVPGGVPGPGGTLEAVGGALPAPPERRASSSRALPAVVASALTVAAGIVAVVVLRSPAPDAPVTPADMPSPVAQEPAAPPTPVAQEPATPPASAEQEPATPPSSALPAASSSASAEPATPPAASPSGAPRAARPARPSSPPPPRRPAPATPTSKGASERDPTFGF
ncbi:protein kinase [Sorangium cellulosum]|uniref:serine/threonine-protein kinase n=1 Tax=Sorangium cellulosum TaxID=56 RepID=UPI003D9AA6DB